MPDPSALTVSEMEVALAWNVRGDPARAEFVAAVETALGVALPTRTNSSARGISLPTQLHSSARGESGVLLCLGPRSWLLVAGRPAADGAFDATRKVLKDAGGALFDVSSSYVAWTVSGAAAAHVLNRGCPLDLHPTAFPAGQCAQSVLGHIHAIFYRPDERSAFIVMVAQSFAADAWEQLAGYAATDGYRVDPPGAFGVGATS